MPYLYLLVFAGGCDHNHYVHIVFFVMARESYCDSCGGNVEDISVHELRSGTSVSEMDISDSDLGIHALLWVAVKNSDEPHNRNV